MDVTALVVFANTCMTACDIIYNQQTDVIHLSSEACITEEDRVFGHAQLERILPQVDAVLVLERVGVCRATVH